MKEKKVLKILVLILFMILIVSITYFVYKFYNEKKTESEVVLDLNNKVNNSSVSYIVLELEDRDAEEKNGQGIEYKNKKITDKNKIDTLMEIINSAIPYKEKEFIGDFGDTPPCAKIYLSNGESYTIVAGDQIEDNGNIVNLMTKYHSEDENDKVLYRVDTKLGEQIEIIFNN